MPRLHHDWRHLAYLHSFSHGLGFCALLAGGEVALPLIADAVPMEYRLLYGAVVALVVAASFVAKIVVMKGHE